MDALPIPVEESHLKERKKTSSAKGKKGKRFLEQKDALDLAAMVGNVQENKAINKAQRRHQTQLAGRPAHDHKTRNSSTDKLREKKAIIISEQSRAKKQKARRKRIASALELKAHGDGGSGLPEFVADQKTRSRKKVSFA